jgi:hypothetical protein
MTREDFFIALLPAFLIHTSGGAALAGSSFNEAGAIVCVNAKWEEKEVEKGHKFVDYAGPCVIVPDDASVPKKVEDCAGNYEFMPDGSWKSAGSCTSDFKNGDKLFLTWEEGSHLKEYVYTYTGGEGKYKGAKGGGTYKTDELTSTLYGGRKSGKLELP